LTGNFEERNWRSIQIGDLVKVKSEKGFKQIPADMIVISSEGTDGHC
jgi:magnesium-transporting ATPase (P-type)